MGEKLSLEDFNVLPAAERISLRRFGQRTRPYKNDVTLAAGVAQQVAPNDPDRLTLLIQNTGTANPGTLTDSAGKTVAQGDVIGANGGAYSADALTDGELVTVELFGISTVGTTVHIEATIGYGPVVELPPGITPL